MPTLRISGADAVAYDDAGQGPLILLVHGSPGTSRAWQPVAERLATRFRVITPSLPGYGGTTPRPVDGPGDSSYAAGLIEALVAEVGPPIVLGGHSYGGAVALVTTLRGLGMPVLCVHGTRSVAMFVKIVEAIASHSPRGIIRKLEKANHAMTTTHPDAVAALIAELADGSA
jgi:pimeloyl-ACP methyl ester carboxylesterase